MPITAGLMESIFAEVEPEVQIVSIAFMAYNFSINPASAESIIIHWFFINLASSESVIFFKINPTATEFVIFFNKLFSLIGYDSFINPASIYNMPFSSI